MEELERDPLTLRQRQVLNYLIQFQLNRGWPPTRREIAEHFGWTDNNAHQHLVVLERKGFIRITPNVSRGITLVEGIA